MKHFCIDKNEAIGTPVLAISDGIVIKNMTFEEFLAYVREHIGNYCTDEYWHFKYDNLEKKTREFIEHEIPFLAINAVGTDYASKNN